MKLSELKIGAQAVVKSIGGTGELRYRLLEMGVVPGVKISLERVAPFNGPLVIVVQRFPLSLRKQDAENIVVELVKKERK